MGPGAMPQAGIFSGRWPCQNRAPLEGFLRGMADWQAHRQLISRIETQFQNVAAQLADPQAVLPFPEGPESARELALKVLPHDDAALQWSLRRPDLEGNAVSPDQKRRRAE